jgi:hypothetical protein
LIDAAGATATLLESFGLDALAKKAFAKNADF